MPTSTDTDPRRPPRVICDQARLDRAIVRSSVDYAMIATDLTGRVVEWNPGAENILGWSAEEMRGRPVDCAFTPEDRASGRPETEMKLAFRDGRASDERWHLRKDGSRFYAAGLMMPLLDEDGATHLGYLKILRDRTGRQHERETLRTLEGREVQYRSVLDALDVGFCIFEVLFDAGGRPVDYRFLEVNPAFHQQTGIEDAVGRTMREIAPLHEQHWFDLYGEVATTGTSIRFENEAQQLGQRWYDVSAMRVGDPGENRVAAIFTDITERRHLEAELRRMNASLEELADQRAVELAKAEEQLRQSQKMEAIGQLTGGVAHDFNNLLTVIRGSVDLLRRPNVSEERRTRYVDAIADTADRAAKLTGQLLAFARRQALRPETFDAAANLGAVRDMIGALVGSRIRMTLSTPADPCFIDADPSQFDTAVVNMCVNARDAMAGEGDLSLTVGTADRIPPVRAHPEIVGDFVTVSIGDTGLGIGPENLDRIFEPFFTTKGVGEGTGLGLSQVFGFAKQSGGEVVAQSEVGAGTTFTLYLPRAHADADRRSLPAAESVDDAGSGTCVLVVEDNAQVGQFATSTLAELGYSTVYAADAAEALRELEKDADRFDVVFSDVIMPGMSGLDLAVVIRERYPHLPVVLTSGYSHVLAEEGSRGFELLHKPYSMDQLSKVLRKAAVQKR